MIAKQSSPESSASAIPPSPQVPKYFITEISKSQEFIVDFVCWNLFESLITFFGICEISNLEGRILVYFTVEFKNNKLKR